MTTKTQTFTNKVKSIRDFHMRLLSGSGIPSVGDIQSTLKFFQTTLQSLLKDAPSIPPESYGSRSKSIALRVSILPSFDYSDLFYSLVSLCEVVCRLTNPNAVCESLINCFSLLTPFLEYDCLDCLPFIIASLLHYFPTVLQSSIMELLCAAVIPLVYSWNEEPESYAVDSIPCILMTVFHLVDKSEYHSWLVESFMSKKVELYRDLLMVIAYGPSESRLPAVCLLFHYWPELCPISFQNSQALQSMKYKFEPWKPIYCERAECPNKASKAVATMMSVEPNVSAKYANKAPPFYICFDCADSLRRQGVDGLIGILRPMQEISHNCESRTCRSQYNRAYTTCYSLECTSLMGGRPVRFCENCHVLRHHGTSITKRHIYQGPLPEVWDCPMEWQTSLVEAIVSLSRETKPRWRQQLLFGSGGAIDGVPVGGIGGDMGDFNAGPCAFPTFGSPGMSSGLGGGPQLLGGGMGMGIPGGMPSSSLGIDPTLSLNNPNLLGATGATLSNKSGPNLGVGGSGAIAGASATNHWLLGSYSDEDHKLLAVHCTFLIGEKCKPRENCNVEILGRICAALFHWFHDTIYTKDGDELGDLVEKIKSEYIIKWIQQVLSMHLEVVLVTLLPHPVEYARIGLYWDTLCDRTTQVKQGLQKLSSLIPYDITTFELWDYIIPYWLETIRTEVPKENYVDLQGLLRKIFDATSGPFPFVPAKLYHFATERFTNTPVAVQDQVLTWLEILTMMGVAVPIKELLNMFRCGVDSLRDPIPLVDALSSSASVTRGSLSHIEMASACGDEPTPLGAAAGIVRPLSCDALEGGELDYEYEQEDSQWDDEDEYELATSVRPPSTGQRNSNSGVRGADGQSKCRGNIPPPVVEEFSVLKCFRLMLKITLDQIKLQDPKAHGNIHNEPSASVMSLCAEMLMVNWEGEHSCPLKNRSQPSNTHQNTCVDGQHQSGTNPLETSTSSNRLSTSAAAVGGKKGGATPEVKTLALSGGGTERECTFCGDCLRWHTLTAQLSHLLTPLKSHRFSELDLPDLSITNSHLSDIHEESEANEEDIPKDRGLTSEPQFDIGSLPMYLKVIHELLREITRYKDVEIIHQILLSFTYLCRHADVLTYAITAHEEFVKYLLKKYFLPILWNLLTSEYSFLASLTVPLLLHCLTLPSGASVFWKILEDDFSSDDWRVRFKAVENVTILARQLEESYLVNNHYILTSLAHAACNLIGTVDDIHPAVVHRAIFYLESIRERSLNCLIRSLEFQFDTVIADRSLILQRMHQLSCALPDRTVFTWDFFLNRFGIFSIEAQLAANPNADSDTISDMNNVNKNSEQFRQQFARARFAFARSFRIRSISTGSGSVRHARRRSSVAATAPLYSSYNKLQHVGGSLRRSPGHGAYARSLSAPRTSTGEISRERLNPRQPSVPQFNSGRRKSKPTLAGLGVSIYQGGVCVTEFTDSGSKFVNIIQAALAGPNRDTLHQWAALLLKYMVTVDVTATQDELRDKKALSKVQRHLALLLGYTEQAFSIPPYKLRSSTVFHAFISNITQVLDRNIQIAQSILHITLVVLQFCASPQRYASDNQPPTFTLWLIEPHTRLHWLNALLVILYKYDISNLGAVSGVSTGGSQHIVEYLVKIALNTVDAHLHVCKKQEEGHSPPTPHMPRARGSKPEMYKDTSNVSGDMDYIRGMDRDSFSASPSPRGSTQCSRVGRASASHYAKRDGDYGGMKITPPVLKKKVQQSRHYRSRSGGVVSTETALDEEDEDVEAFNASGNKAAALPSQYRRRSRRVEYMVESDESDDGEGMIELQATTKTLSTNEENGSPVLLDEDVLSPVTVSHDEQDISPPLVESEGIEMQMLKSKGGSDSATNVSGQVSTFSPADTASVDDKIAEQLRAFQKGTSSTSTNLVLDENGSASHSKSVNGHDDVEEFSTKPNFRQKKTRKSGLSSVAVQKVLEERQQPTRRRIGRGELSSSLTPEGTSTAGVNRRPAYQRSVEAFMIDRCPQCSAVLEHYDEETLGLAMVCVSTFVQREPVLAAPMLLDALTVGARLAAHPMYSWKSNLPHVVLQSNASSIARQFLRCTLFHLAPNGLFTQLFQTYINDDEFFKTIVAVLIEFEEHMNFCQPLETLLCSINEKRGLPLPNIIILLHNILRYLECMPTMSDDSKANHQMASWWSTLLPHFETFLRRLPLLIQQSTGSNSALGSLASSGSGLGGGLVGASGAASVGGNACGVAGSGSNAIGGGVSGGMNASPTQYQHHNIATQLFDLTSVIRIMIALLRSPVITNFKSMIDEYCLVLRYMVQNCRFQLPPLLELCSITNRIFKDRGRSQLTKTLVEELHQALKFKISIPDDNIMMLMQFVLMDAGGTVEPNKISEGLTKLFNPQSYHILNTGAAEMMRAHLQDCILFISDVHAIQKVQESQKAFGGHSLHEDTLGPHLKSAAAQFIALELSRNFNTTAGKTDALMLQYLPWLKSIPPATQQGPREFILCVERIRTLSWLLLGSMIHTAVTRNSTGISCLPIPLNYNKSIADLVKVILSGFPDQQKKAGNAPISERSRMPDIIGRQLQSLTVIQSVVVMSSLSHAFNLCQLWTMYCESWAAIHVGEITQQQAAMNTAMDFWARIMPTIIHLLTISDDFNVVNGHLLGIMDQLIECRSASISKIITLLIPILHGRNKSLTGNNAKRLQKCIEWEPPEPDTEENFFTSNMLIDCLKRHVIVLGKNEAQQSSAATHIIVI